ncbi:cytochrome P450 [Mycobacterium syngnathidarum]
MAVKRLSAPPRVRMPGVVQTAMWPYRGLLRQARRVHGGMFSFSHLGRTTVAVCTAEEQREVFTGEPTIFHADERHKLVKPLIGEQSVITLNEGDHRRIRKLLAPAFHGAAMRDCRDVMNRLAADEADSWSVGFRFTARPRMNAVTLAISVQAMFGASADTRIDELSAALSRVTQLPLGIWLGLAVSPLQRFRPWRQLPELFTRIYTIIGDEIAVRGRPGHLTERTDMLSHLLNAEADGDRLTDNEIRDQMVSLLLAAQDTPAAALAWALHDLAHDPALQAAAHAAVDSGDERYIEAVVKETMRLHPPTENIGRTLTGDVQLGGYRVPAGHSVLLCIDAVHLDPANHPDPQRFRPERFLDGTATSANWLPFGGGVRRCIGAQFATEEVAAVLREVLSRYRIEPGRGRPERLRSRAVANTPSHGALIVARRR